MSLLGSRKPAPARTDASIDATVGMFGGIPKKCSETASPSGVSHSRIRSGSRSPWYVQPDVSNEKESIVGTTTGFRLNHPAMASPQIDKCYLELLNRIP